MTDAELLSAAKREEHDEYVAFAWPDERLGWVSLAIRHEAGEIDKRAAQFRREWLERHPSDGS